MQIQDIAQFKYIWVVVLLLSEYVILHGFMLQIIYTTVFLDLTVKLGKPWYKYYKACIMKF